MLIQKIFESFSFRPSTGIQLLSDDDDRTPEDEQVWLFAWVEFLKERGCFKIDMIVDAYNGVYCWWMMRKPPYATVDINAMRKMKNPRRLYNNDDRVKGDSVIDETDTFGVDSPMMTLKPALTYSAHINRDFFVFFWILRT